MSDHQHNHNHDEDDEEFITQDDVLAEVPDLGDDIPMDDDDENGDDDDDPSGITQSAPSIPPDANFEQAFSEHGDSVFTIAGHPANEPLAVSGGADDLAYIWDITDGEVIVKLTGHTDSVTCAAWSNDGEMVSTGGMDGKVRVWRRIGKDDFKRWDFVTELQGPDEVMVGTC